MEESLIKSIKIENFKAFENINFDNLSRFNLIYGRNNSGKTCLLEALHLAFSNINPLQSLLAIFRDFPFIALEDSLEDIGQLLFYNFNEKKKIHINLEFESDNKLQVDILKPLYYIKEIPQEFETKINHHSIFINYNYFNSQTKFEKKYLITPLILKKGLKSGDSESVDLSFLNIGNFSFILKPQYYFLALGKIKNNFLIKVYGDIVKKGLKDKLVSCLIDIDKSIKDIDIITVAEEQSIGIKINDKFYPLNVMGEGFYKIFSIISIMLNKQNGILLIDEIENGIYWKIQGTIWKYIEKYMEEFNIQIFATTHSYEFMQNVVNNISNPQNITGIKIKETKSGLKPVILKGEDFIQMIKNNFEVR
jgi:AAA15 family ATPase/GTPase